MEPQRPKIPAEAIELHNPERYNKAAADQAWRRTIEWFNKYMRGTSGS